MALQCIKPGFGIFDEFLTRIILCGIYVMTIIFLVYVKRRYSRIEAENMARLDEIRSQFVSLASHEFKTPLSTVLSSAALLSRYKESADQEKRDRHIKKIRESAKHINDLLEDILVLGKLEDGRVQVEVTVFSLAEFLEEVLGEARSVTRPGQEIFCEYQGNGVFASDRRLLKNVFTNLLRNAVKFSPGGAYIRVQVDRPAAEILSVSIRDEGIGVSPSDQEYLFNSFFRGSNAVNIEGTGLGLHIVKRYITLLGGTMQFNSILDKGTTVRFEVPQGKL